MKHTQESRFHNRYVKNKIITSVSNPGNILMSVGKAGDLQKWLMQNSFFWY